MFPRPLPLPQGVLEARQRRKEQLVRSVRQAMLLRLGIALLELAVVFLFGSAALLLDALSSLTDIVGSALLIACIAMAARPPDADHPFGHGRYEPLIGLGLAVVLVVAGGGLFLSQLSLLFQEKVPEPLPSFLWIVPFFAACTLEVASWIVRRSASQMHSSALAVEAAHYRIDAMTSVAAAVALFLAEYSEGWSYFFDHLGAAVIAAIMILLGLMGMRKNVQQLTDRIPHDDHFEMVRTAALSVSGVLGTEKLRIQAYGPDAFVSIDVEVDPTLTVEVAHQISQQVRVAIQQAWPSVQDAIVHIEPFYPGDH